MQEISFLICARRNPKELLGFLGNFESKLANNEILIYVDNNDNITCPYINTIKFKFKRKLNLNFFINLPKNSVNERYEYLEAYCNSKKIIRIYDLKSFDFDKV